MKKILLLASVIIGMTSCSNDDVFVEKTNETNQSKEFTLIAKYKDLTYEVPCTLENDSLIYLDQVFSDLYHNEIALIENLAMLTYKDEKGRNVIEYHKSAQELETKAGISYFNDIATNHVDTKFTVQPTAGRAILYDDTNFKDRETPLDIDYDYMMCIPHLKPYNNFNDKTSAIRVFNFLHPDVYYKPSNDPNYFNNTLGRHLRTCLIGYEHDNYRGKVLYCVATYSSSADLSIPQTATHNDWKLGEIGWNDKITSVVFRIITTKNIEDGIYTPH